MSQPFDLILKGGTVMTPGGAVLADVGVRGGKIVEIGELSGPAEKILDCRNLHVLPGVIDTQVHFREPGPVHKEDLATGTLGAVMGGVTAIFEMPNTDPLTLAAADLQDKLDRAKGRTFCDHAFFMGGSAVNAAELAALERLPGCCGVKIFMGSSTGNLLASDDVSILSILSHGARRVAVHAEDEERLKARKSIVEASHDVREHHVWRDEETAIKATRRVLALARQAGRRIHVLHVTTAEEMEILAEHKDIATVEVTPQHLTLSAPECYERLGTFAQMNPPVREARHREGLWRAINQGVVDVIGSDHAPHTREEKAKIYPASPSGMTGVQTTVPLMLDHVNAGRLSLERMVDLLCHGPQRIYQIAGKGRLARGYDADFTIVDLKRRATITNEWIQSRSGWTPFDGMTVTGWPQGTVIRGNVVMWDGEVPAAVRAAPPGIPVQFAECLS